MSVNRWTAAGLGGLAGFVGLGQYVDVDGPIGTLVAIGAVGCLALAIYGSFRAIEADVLRDLEQEADDEDVRNAIENLRSDQ